GSAIQQNPNNAQEYARRGYTYAEMRDYEKAIPDFQQALKLNPNDPDTPMRLQYAQSMMAQKNQPTPTPIPDATPAPVATSLFTPLNIVLGVVVLGILAAVIRLITRGKAEPTSS